MAKLERDEEREERITMEIIVDAYGSEEQALGWYSYLDEQLQMPFTATCIAERATSPLVAGETVEVIGMPSEDVCQHEMFVSIIWQKRTFAVPLAQIAGVDVDQQTQQAIEDWQYWINRGHTL